MTLKEILENTKQAIDAGKDNLENYVFDLILIASKSVYDHDIITPDILKCIDELLCTINNCKGDYKNKYAYLFGHYLFGQMDSILRLLKQIGDYQKEDFIIRDILPLSVSNDMICCLNTIRDNSIEVHKLPISWQNYIEWLEKRDARFFIKRTAGQSVYYHLSSFGKRLLEKAKEEQQNAVNA